MTDVFFVLNGLVNGEEGVKALPAGGGQEEPLSDGWYFLHGENPDGLGPHRSRDEAVRKAEWAAGMGRLDAADVVRAFISGHLSPMDDTTRMAYADAPAFCLCVEVGYFFVTVGREPEDADWRCEVYLGDEAALVDLKEGTWERL